LVSLFDFLATTIGYSSRAALPVATTILSTITRDQFCSTTIYKSAIPAFTFSASPNSTHYQVTCFTNPLPSPYPIHPKTEITQNPQTTHYHHVCLYPAPPSP
jgi:hypothetical protein